MGWYQKLKGIVPLQWKMELHQHKGLPKYVATRLYNSLKGRVPLPPGKLIYLVAGHRDAEIFLESGRSMMQAIRRLLNKHDVKIEELGDILDFGCGVGRIMRHWSTTEGPRWHGTDYNPQLIEWCRNNLKFAEFRVNTLSGQLQYEAESFD